MFRDGQINRQINNTAGKGNRLRGRVLRFPEENEIQHLEKKEMRGQFQS